MQHRISWRVLIIIVYYSLNLLMPCNYKFDFTEAFDYIPDSDFQCQLEFLGINASGINGLNALLNTYPAFAVCGHRSSLSTMSLTIYLRVHVWPPHFSR
jgi:hypothetical protein